MMYHGDDRTRHMDTLPLPAATGEKKRMPGIVAEADNLIELNANFSQQRLQKPDFLNSVPGCGTHLLRNVVRMFVPVEQQYHKAFIQHANLREHQVAFSEALPHLSWGHLLFSDEASILIRRVQHVVQVRDPCDWVLARTRFFLSDTFQGSLEHLKSGNVAVDEVVNMMIFGIHQKVPSLNEIFTHNAVSWLGTKAKLLQFEDLIHHVKNLESDAAESFFSQLLADCGIEALPEDWRERVRVGSGRRRSATAREHLAGGGLEVPDSLPDVQRQLVDKAAPGLRTILGYE